MDYTDGLPRLSIVIALSRFLSLVAKVFDSRFARAAAALIRNGWPKVEQGSSGRASNQRGSLFTPQAQR